MLLFNGKYRIESARLRNWDYGWNGKYFVTIVTKYRKHFFGEIIDEKMHFSEIGTIANECWNHIPKHFPFVILDEFCVMPNHIHGIININKKNNERNIANDHYNNDKNNVVVVETQNFASLQIIRPQITQSPQIIQPKQQPSKSPTKNQFGPQSKNLGSIIRGFKIGVTNFVNENNYDFGWQSRFYDRIIRNEKSLNRIRNYIRSNPKNWNIDKFNS